MRCTIRLLLLLAIVAGILAPGPAAKTKNMLFGGMTDPDGD